MLCFKVSVLMLRYWADTFSYLKKMVIYGNKGGGHVDACDKVFPHLTYISWHQPSVCSGDVGHASFHYKGHTDWDAGMHWLFSSVVCIVDRKGGNVYYISCFSLICLLYLHFAKIFLMLYHFCTCYENKWRFDSHYSPSQWVLIFI